jgi:hypothetical protein
MMFVEATDAANRQHCARLALLVVSVAPLSLGLVGMAADARYGVR